MNLREKIIAWLNLRGDSVALILVLFIASLLRLWLLWDVPFMHDEFSALFRTRFDTFSDLITFGVIENDSHPAGVQVFLYYWVQWFGFNAFWVKLPFVLMGVASVGLIALIGRLWFNSTTALIVAALAACLQFFVFYSQLARPYAAGLFFILLAVYWWTKILQTTETVKLQSIVFLALAFVLAALMHYFSMLLAGIIFLSGLFLMKKNNWKPYVASGVLAFIIYLPHLKVFLAQIGAGGIGGWLGAPSYNFVFEFVGYLFHFSWMFGFVLFGLVFFVLKRPIIGKSNNHFIIIGFLWFFVSFAIAYAYSVLRTPILQFSTLYFSAPFLLLALFSFVKQQKPIVNLLLVAIILAVGTITLVLDRQYYDLMYHQGYDQIANEMEKDQLKFGNDIAFAAVGGSEEMFSFYLDKKEIAKVQLYNFREKKEELLHSLDTTTASYFGVAWTDYAPYEWIALVRNRYGNPIRHLSWFNSEYFLFSKLDIEQQSLLFEGERSLLNENFVDSGLFFEKETTYGLLWEAKCDTILNIHDDLILSEVSGIASDTLKAVKLVLEFKLEGESKPLYWMSGILVSEVLAGEPFVLQAAFRFDTGPKSIKTAILRTYIWNSGNEKFRVLDRQVHTRPHDPRLLGLYAPIN